MKKRDFLERLKAISEAQSRENIFPDARFPKSLSLESCDDDDLDTQTGECSSCKLQKPIEELEITEAEDLICWDCLAKFDERDRKSEEKNAKKERKIEKRK